MFIKVRMELPWLPLERGDPKGVFGGAGNVLYLDVNHHWAVGHMI